MGQLTQSVDDVVGLEAVISTAELSRRPSRDPDYQAENIAMVALAQEMTRSPQRLLQKLVETALNLCGAGSAGISLLEEEGGSKIFRWRALTGALAPHLLGTTPRDFSPCGTVLDRKAIQLFTNLDRHFKYFGDVKPRIVEALLIPFSVGGEAVGTVWVVSHDDSRQFDGEDGRLLSNLGKFAAAAYQTLSSLEAVKAADRRKDEFLAMLAHELRNPLSPIQNAAEVLKLVGSPDPNLQLARDMIERQIHHLVRLVDDLLDVSRISSGKITLQLEPLDLATVIVRAVETSRPLLDTHKHELSVVLPPEALHVEADATRLVQVFANLLNNAAKYSPEGGHIRLAVAKSGCEGVVRVRDNGMGIAAKLLPKVFDLFMQGDRSLARSGGGLGIGLTVVKNLVELHGGTITAHSEGPGKGSEFVVRLPALAQDTGDRVAKKVADRRPSPTSSHRVLVVDDNVDAADAMALLLRTQGHHVRTALDGPSALAAASMFMPDVVILDIGLPGMDGYEVARHLRQQPDNPQPYLVALTGYGQAEDRRQAATAGFNAHLTKPADLDVLRHLLAEVRRGAPVVTASALNAN